MKYLPLFESFESSALSKIAKFLTNKGVQHKSKFINDLKSIGMIYQFPIDKISDKYIKYLNKLSAVKIKSPEGYTNTQNAYCVKFWFSLENGYLGYTGTGHKEFDFIKPSYPFDENEMRYIKEQIKNTGIIKQVNEKDYNTLKIGDQVIARLGTKLGMGEIWKDSQRICVLNDVSDGTTPNGPEWRQRGFRYSWSIADANGVKPDHSKLHLYYPDDEPLRIYNDPKSKDVFDFNLPLDTKGIISNWDNPQSISSSKDIDRSDFAIILFLDDLLKSPFKLTSGTREEREVSKTGATKLMSDKYFKSINIKKYLTSLIGKMGISKDVGLGDLKDLQFLLMRNLCDEFAFISIYRNKPDYHNIYDFIDKVRNLIQSDNYGKEGRLRSLEDYFRCMKTDIADNKENYKKLYKSIESFGLDHQKEFFSRTLEISTKIQNYLKNNPTNTIDDFKFIIHKIKSIKSFIDDPDYNFSTAIRYIVHYIGDDDRVEHEIRRFKNDLAEDLKKLEIIERYIDYILK